MRQHKRRPLVGPGHNGLTVAAIFCALFLFPQIAKATTCRPGKPHDSVHASDVIFEAVAVNIRTASALETLSELKVTKVYRGEVPAQILVHHGGLAGYTSFALSARYLVFGTIDHEDPARLFVGLCSATHQLPAAGSYARPPWSSWAPETKIGSPRAPRGPLQSAKAASTTAPKREPVKKPTAPLGTVNTPPSSAPSTQPTSPNLPKNPAPLAPHHRSGCSFRQPQDEPPLGWLYAGALALLFGRRLRCMAEASR